MNTIDKLFTKMIKIMVKNDQCQIILPGVNAGTGHILIQDYFKPMLLFALIHLQTVLSHIEIIQIHAVMLKIDNFRQ